MNINIVVHSLLGGHSSTMTDAERDQIDNDAQGIIKTCRQTIGRFRQEAEQQRVHPQVKEHRAVVIFLIDGYLKGEHFITPPGNRRGVIFTLHFGFSSEFPPPP